MNKKIVLFCTLIGLLTPCAAVSAKENTALSRTPQTYEEHASREDSYVCPADSDSFKGWPKGPLVYADSAVLTDMDTGAVLYSKNADKLQFPASITKFMTALVALENADPNDEVYFTEDSVSFLEYGDASIGMRPGEVISMTDALHAMLLASANEVSHAVAENVGRDRLGGDYNTFIEKMNTRAEKIGCTGSHWVNACGLHDDMHYTTAHDMAVIASVLYRQPLFHTIMGSLQYTIPPTNLESEPRTFQQNHKMLWADSEFYYEYCKGGKTGYTDQSGTTLVTMADNGTRRLAAVVMHDYGADAYKDTRAMFDYGFDEFRNISLADNETSSLIRSFDDGLAQVTVPIGTEFYKLDRKIEFEGGGTEKAKVEYTYNGQPVGTFDVRLTEEGYRELTGFELERPVQETSGETESLQKKEKEDISLEITFGVISFAAAFFAVGLPMFFRYRHIRRARRRRRARAGRGRTLRANRDAVHERKID